MKSSRNNPTYHVGYTFTNKQGLKAEVIAYRGRKDIDVMFEDGEVVKGTSGTYIKKGLPLHPTHGKTKVGDIFPCQDGDRVEVVEYLSSARVKVRWESDGAEKWRSLRDIKLGINKHPTRGTFKSGDVVRTNRCGDVTVVKVSSATDIIVRFDDGVEKKTNAHNLREGSILHPHGVSIRIGNEYSTNCGWKCVVVGYEDAHNVLVEWGDGSRSKHAAKEVKSGSIKPLTYPSIAGVGYVGYGKYIPKSYTSKKESWQSFVDEEIYGYWSRMISRCYDEKEQARLPTYNGCEVNVEWHCFQNFAEWALGKSQAGMKDEKGKIFHLEKDVLSRGHKRYSPDTCTFLPARLNSFLAEKCTNGLPRGVNRISPKTPNSREGYVARCTVDGDRKYLGFTYCPMEAFNLYKPVKEAYARELAEEYKDVLEPHVYEQLLKYEVKPFD